MNIRIISIGRLKDKSLQSLEQEFLKRLSSSPLNIEQIELPAAKPTTSNLTVSPKLESEKILQQIRDSDFVIALDEKGKQMSSPALAKWLQGKMNSGQKVLAFVIGGAYGLDPAVTNRANFILSLSELTFPFQFARILLIEQLYRAHSIINGASYHKE